MRDRRIVRVSCHKHLLKFTFPDKPTPACRWLEVERRLIWSKPWEGASTVRLSVANVDLQRDKEGNLYYAKSGQYTSYALPGSVIKVSPDGKREVHCTGFRTPNGMGIMPDGRVTVSDNQGSWMPASKVSLCKQGGQ